MGRRVPREESELTPEEFERVVKALLDVEGQDLESYSSDWRKKVQSHDGEYEFDIVAKFRWAGGIFFVVAECKKYKNPIERQLVHYLHSRIQSVGANKGFMYATASYQQGAIDFAEKHGLTLVELRLLPPPPPGPTPGPSGGPGSGPVPPEEESSPGPKERIHIEVFGETVTLDQSVVAGFSAKDSGLTTLNLRVHRTENDAKTQAILEQAADVEGQAKAQAKGQAGGS